MLRKLFLSCTALLVCSGGPLLAESYTVNKAVETALKNNSTIMQNRIEMKGLERKKKISLNGLSPSLSVGAGVSHPNEPTTYENSAYWMANVSFSFSAAIAANVKQAKINYEAGLISQETVLKSIELSVRQSFYGLLYEKVNIDLQKRNLETAKSRYDQTMVSYKAGRVPELDVLTAKVTWEQLKPALASVETTYENDLASFKQLIGVGQSTPMAIEGSLNDAQDLKEISIENITAVSNSVKTTEKNLELAKATLSAARMNAYSPVFSMGYTYQPAKGYDPVDPYPESEWQDAGEITAGVTVPLDGLMPWSVSNDNIATARENVETLQLQLQEEKTSSAVTIDSLIRQIRQSQASVKAQQENIVLAEKSYKMMEEAYRHGVRDLLSLQDSADSLFESRVTLMSESYTLMSTVLQLEYEIGVPFGSLGR